MGKMFNTHCASGRPPIKIFGSCPHPLLSLQCEEDGGRLHGCSAQQQLRRLEETALAVSLCRLTGRPTGV